MMRKIATNMKMTPGKMELTKKMMMTRKMMRRRTKMGNGMKMAMVETDHHVILRSA